MLFCMKRDKKKAKKYKKNKVVPKNLEYKGELSPSKNILLEEYVDKIDSKYMTCYHCKNIFNLQDIRINCGKCNQFFHCFIAGKCRGKNCSEIINGEIHSLSYCLSCVNPMTCRGNTCLCNDCVIERKKK